jgi:hypothetical protein
MAQKKFLWLARRFSTIFEYFGWKRELYRIFHEDHENRVLFLRQLNGYLAMGTFINRKYETPLVFSNLKNVLCFLTNKHQ